MSAIVVRPTPGFYFHQPQPHPPAKNEQASAWLTAIEGLPAVHERLQRVALLNRPALKVIEDEDTPTTLFYTDSPYLHETRTARAVYGDYEMSDDDHREMLQLLASIEGKAMVSGYRCDRYDQMLAAGTATSSTWPTTPPAESRNAA